MALTKVSRGLLTTSIVDNGNATAITIDSSENVGIGCSPSYPLEVAGAAGDSLTITARSGDATAANNAGGGFRNIGSATATSRSAQIWLDADGANLGGGDYFYIEKKGNSGDLILSQFSNADMIFQVNAGAERMRIDGATGNVGIGTPTPDTTLHLQTPSGTKSEINFAQTAVTNYRIGVPASTDALVFTYGASTERMRIDSAGNLGINNPNPAQILSICNPANPNRNGMEIAIGASDTSSNTIQNYNRATGAYTPLNIAGNILTFGSGTSAQEALRIDASRNVNVARTGYISSSTNGFHANNEGWTHTSASSQPTAYFNRNTSDGEIIRFSKDGTTVGSIGVSSGAYLTIGTGDTGILFDDAGNRFYPCNASTQANLDNAIDIGASNVRFKDLYLAGAATLGGASYDSTKTISSQTTGTTSGHYAFFGVGTQTGANGRLNFWELPNTNDSGAYIVYAQASGANVFNVRGDGDVENLNNSYTGTSDQKLKENIQDASSQWDDIKDLRVRKYSFIAENLSEPNQIGVIAQELEAAGMSGLVKDSSDMNMKTGEDLGTVTKTVKYSILYMKAVKALQEAMERIETLEAKVQTLENN